MTRPVSDYLAHHIAEFSEATIRAHAAEQQAALTPVRHMQDEDRKANLVALAEIILREAGWKVPPVVMPCWRSHVKDYSTSDDHGAFGRLLIAVASHNERDRDAALERLVPGEVAA